MHINSNDTIAAISTPPGVGGIGIIRLSGKKALKIGDKIFRSKSGKKISKAPGFTVHYGHIVEKNNKSKSMKLKVLDEALFTVMRAPRTYTREDVLEINCHGGIVPSRRVLELVIDNGARLAAPGEFTQRAFLNGRIDLLQAEASLNIINAKTEAALKPAVYQLEGRLSAIINKMRDELIEFIAPLEAAIDFPDESMTCAPGVRLSKTLRKIAKALKGFIEGADKGIMLQNGISIVLAGAANVGKSSIMNALVEYERVIVTNISGTTRDVVQELININGIPVRIADTAGIMDSSCVITKESVARSLAFSQKADLVLFVLDSTREINKTDLDVAKKLKNKKVVIVVNKSDLKSKINYSEILKIFPGASRVKISALRKQGMAQLEHKIVSQFFKGEIVKSEELTISNLRQKKSLEECYGFINNAILLIKNKGFEECLIFEIRQALNSLGSLVGEDINEDILDNIFNRFCIGK
ncbi:MAG: tRNA uridine-5-carboxymethylaminomethyl(34) synthesis GTPase MnmE [Candidatus Omnitrophica bacterium]|nr:tRNA uridine-5-carboxymethylaminomethyl(34) synthesis GTPase MnmE [Candidatus Omnitrophota bacterium]